MTNDTASVHSPALLNFMLSPLSLKPLESRAKPAPPSVQKEGNVDSATHTRESILRLRDYVNQRILGQDHLVERMLVALLADGHLLVCEPAKELPMAQRYFLF